MSFLCSSYFSTASNHRSSSKRASICSEIDGVDRLAICEQAEKMADCKAKLRRTDVDANSEVDVEGGVE